MSVNDITSADLSMFDTGYRMLGAGARGRSREMISGGRWERGSGLGTHVHPWLIHVNVWQNQYSIVKQNKVKIFSKKRYFLLEDRPWNDILKYICKITKGHHLPISALKYLHTH